MRSQQNSDGAWTLPRSRSARRPKSWQPSPPTRMKSPPATSRPSPAKAHWIEDQRASLMRHRRRRVGLRRDQAVEVRGELIARNEGGDEPLPLLSLTGKSAFGPSRHAPEMSTFGVGLDVTQAFRG